MQFVQYLWLEVFVEQRCLCHLKNTLNMVAMETKVCHVIKLWTSFQKNFTVGCSYKRNMVFNRGGTMCPPWPQELKKCLAWIGLRHMFTRHTQIMSSRTCTSQNESINVLT